MIEKCPCLVKGWRSGYKFIINCSEMLNLSVLSEHTFIYLEKRATFWTIVLEFSKDAVWVEKMQV